MSKYRNKRRVSAHQTNDCNRAISVFAYGPITTGSAQGRYLIQYAKKRAVLKFHSGDPRSGVNGITHEVLLAILADRIEGMQASKFAHPLNAQALSHVRSALRCLEDRTAERLQRGVEGTQEV